MPNILTPLTLWESFNSSLETLPETVSVKEENGIRIERVKFHGRETRDGRVIVAASYAYNKKTPSTETVLILPDSKGTIDDELLKLFANRGYSALMVDYRGKWDGCDFYTQYPADVDYANFASSGAYYSRVDTNAVETSWYEWVAVGIYAKKYAEERSGNGKIAVVGLRDGGEIAWKLGVAEEFSCIIPVCAAGWRAYLGMAKYMSGEPDLNEERYRFIAGIDSQAYAPYVRCPVLMLCSTNDAAFDYDRAYDTFSRINPKFIGESAIAYSVHFNGCIGWKCAADMFMFLDRNLKNRHVFIPKPAEISVEVDEESNLIARAMFDDQGIVESCSVYIAEDCVDSVMRDWTACPAKSKITPKEQEFYLNIYEKTSTVFVFGCVKYINGFTVWSKIVAKKISGAFRNMQSKSRVLYSDKEDTGGFTSAAPEKFAVGGIFIMGDSEMPKVVEKTSSVRGLYSKTGLTTYRLNNPKFTPTAGNVLKLDIFCDSTSTVKFSFLDMGSGEEYTDDHYIVGGVWQSIIVESKFLKNQSGVALAAFSSDYKLTITGGAPFAVNNIMWL